MKFRIEKNLRILSELITFYHKQNCDDVKIDVKTEEGLSFFRISGRIDNFSDEQLESLNTVLNIPRQHEVEQYYWNLGGNTELDCELSLVGVMVDNALIEYKDNILTLSIHRKEES